MPSLPGQRSNLIVKGTTSTCEANISSDRTATFTTCGVEIEKVIKNSTTANLSQDSKVIVTREGGNAEIGGLKVASSVAGQALPQPATTYIFFLRYRPAAHDYMILTFYRVTSQGMQALDEPPFFHIHDGKRVGAFLADVDSSMSDESQYLRHHIAEEAK
jgi:hypothetical protein